MYSGRDWDPASPKIQFQARTVQQCVISDLETAALCLNLVSIFSAAAPQKSRSILELLYRLVLSTSSTSPFLQL